MTTESIGTARRWSMLAIALAATLCANVFINGVGVPHPNPAHRARASIWPKSGLMSSMPSFGMVVTLIAWGYVVDRFGERMVLAVGSALTAAAAFAAASVHSLLRSSAFPVPRRHGRREQQLRQRSAGRGLVSTRTARPGDGHPPDRTAAGSRLGRVGDSATRREPRNRQRPCCFPPSRARSPRWSCAVGVLDPPRPPRAEADAADLANPYRGSSTLWRIHAVSVLLVVPQVLVWTFTLVWLITDRGWSAASAGAMVTAAQTPRRGRANRGGSMVGQDRFATAPDPHHRHRRRHRDGTAGGDRPAALTRRVAVMVVASVITVSDNGLAFTAIAEIAGPFWSGRALGTQNTSQLLTAGIVPPLFGA